MQKPNFQPAHNQRQWVRDKFAAIRNPKNNRWVFFGRADKKQKVHPDGSGGGCKSIWVSAAVGASFPDLISARIWVEHLPQV
jgi:hypothetical protein